jgi:quinol monooxygenase YgiN
VVIVVGTFEVEPDQREEFLASRHDSMRKSRAEPGCLEYTFSADPIDPSRVLLVERWESQEMLGVHLSGQRPPQSPSTDVVPKTVAVTVYDVTGERSLADSRPH